MRTSTLVVSLVLLALGAQPARADDCQECHTQPSKDGSYRPILDGDAFEASVHAKVACTDCHAGTDAAGWKAIPHVIKAGGTKRCADCHAKDFPEEIKGYRHSVHARNLRSFTCSNCHNPHTMPAQRAAPLTQERVRQANRTCYRCHRDKIIEVTKRKGAKGLTEAHAWMTKPKSHAKMRCIVCHTTVEGDDIHDILPREQSNRSCEACHDQDGALLAKFGGGDDRSSWVTNPLLFENAYVIGATRNRVVDGAIVALFGLTLLGLLGHATLRLLTRKRRPAMSAKADKVRMYPVWLRLWHWSNALLIIALAYTGLRLHFGQRTGIVMSFEEAFNLHNVLGAVLVLVGLFFLIANLLSGNQRQYLSKPQDGFQGIFKQARWYLLGIFRGDPHPYHSTPERKFNPLQHVAYLLLMYVVYPLLLLTGVALLYPHLLPQGAFGRPGVWWVAALHWLLAAGLILFLLGHVYLASMGDKVRDLYLAMIDGKHRSRTPK